MPKKQTEEVLSLYRDKYFDLNVLAYNSSEAGLRERTFAETHGRYRFSVTAISKGWTPE